MTLLRKRILKWILKGFLALFSAIVVLILLVFVINLPVFDEELHPELTKILTPPEMPLPEQNAYIALLGIAADSERDMLVSGQDLYERYEDVHKQGGHTLSIEDYIEILGEGFSGEGASKSRNSEDLQWWNQLEICDLQLGLDCLKALTPEVEKIRENERYQLIVSRYNQLIELPYFIETYKDSVLDDLQKSYNLLLWSSSLHLADVYNLQPDAFLNLLEKDMTFWAMAITSRNDAIAKVIAITSVRRNARFLSEYLSENSVDDQEVQQVRAILNLFNNDNKGLGLGLYMHAHYAGVIAGLTDYNASWWEDALIQENAYRNMYYENRLSPSLEISEYSASEYDELVEQYIDSENSILDCCRLGINELSRKSINFLYNPIIKMIAPIGFGVSTGALEEDIYYRFHNLVGMLDLVKLHLEILESPDADPFSVIEQSDIRNPYTGEAMNFDPIDSTLSFECRGFDRLCAVKL